MDINTTTGVAFILFGILVTWQACRTYLSKEACRLRRSRSLARAYKTLTSAGLVVTLRLPEEV